MHLPNPAPWLYPLLKVLLVVVFLACGVKMFTSHPFPPRGEVGKIEWTIVTVGLLALLAALP